MMSMMDVNVDCDDVDWDDVDDDDVASDDMDDENVEMMLMLAMTWIVHPTLFDFFFFFFIS